MIKSTWIVILERIDTNGESMMRSVKIANCYLQNIVERIEQAYPNDDTWGTIIHAIINQDHVIELPKKKEKKNGKAARAFVETE